MSSGVTAVAAEWEAILRAEKMAPITKSLPRDGGPAVQAGRRRDRTRGTDLWANYGVRTAGISRPTSGRPTNDGALAKTPAGPNPLAEPGALYPLTYDEVRALIAAVLPGAIGRARVPWLTVDMVVDLLGETAEAETLARQHGGRGKTVREIVERVRRKVRDESARLEEFCPPTN